METRDQLVEAGEVNQSEAESDNHPVKEGKIVLMEEEPLPIQGLVELFLEELAPRREK